MQISVIVTKFKNLNLNTNLPHFMFKKYLVLLLALNHAVTNAQVKIEKEPQWKVNFTPTKLKPNPKDVSDGYFELLVEKQQHVELEAHYTHIVREIVSASGVQNGSGISVNYEPAFQKLVFHKITIRRNGQEINKLTPSAVKISPIEEERSRFLYNGTNNASVILEDIRKGDLIDYSYTITGENPIFEKKFFDNFYLYTNYPVSQLYEAIIVSSKRKLYTKEFNNPAKPKISTKDGLTIYEWNLILPKIYKFEDYEPQWHEGYPYVEFSEYNSWKQVVDWALPLYKIPKQAPVSLNAKISEFKKAADGDLDKYAELATRFTQDEIRYMGIEVGTNSHQPHAPEKVFQQRYGDCKDKSFLLCNLLAGAGIEAYPALVNTYKKRHLNQKQPSPIAFNHVIVYANILGNWTFIDPTISYQRGRIVNGYIPDYGKALVIKPGQTELIDIPENYAGTTTITEKYTIPEIGKTATLEVVSRYSISYANSIRDTFAEKSLTDLEQTYTDYYAGLFSKPAFVKLDTLYYNDEEKDNIFTVTERYTIEDIWEKQDSTKNINSITIWGQLLKDQFKELKDKSRISPIAISYPYDFDYTVEVVFPENWTINNEGVHLKRDSYEFTEGSYYEASTKTWKIHYTYKTLKDHVLPENYAQYNDDVNKMIDELGKTITWNPDLDNTQNADSPTNWLMVFIGITCMIGFAFLVHRFNQYSLPVTDNKLPLQLGGWVGVYGFVLGITPLYVIYALFVQNSYLNINVWNAFGEDSYFYKSSLIFEFVFIIARVFWISLLLILFFNRRNTFPKLAIYYHYFLIIYMFLDWMIVIYVSTYLNTEMTADSSAVDFFKTVIYGAIWISFLNRSQRVKDTFTLAHKSKADKHHRNPDENQLIYRLRRNGDTE